MGDEKEMKIYSFGEETKPAILLLPGTCCHWKRNFGHVIPLLQEHFYVLCASYDGFDETEDSTFPNMLIETAKLENYIQKNLDGQLFAAYGCSLGGSFVGLMVQRKKIHIRHGILGSSDLDQGSSFGTWAMAKAMTPLLGKMLRSGKLPVWAKKKMEEKAGAEYAQAMLQLFGCSAATQELPSMAFVSNTSIFNQFFSDMVTPLEDDIYVPGTKIHCFYAVKMGEEYENRYRRHFVDPDIRYHAMQHEELLACYPEQWVEEVLASCRLNGRGMEENDFEERHFTEAERAQAEITESGNPRKPEGEDGKKMLERMNESHHNVTGWALSLWEIQGNDNILDIGCGGGAAGAGSAAGSAAGKAADGAAAEPVEVHVASLKGPTSIGLVQFMDQAADGETDNEFDFAINTAADEIVPKVIQGDIDIALVPANVASVLYNKTEGAVQVIGINTLGVLNVVTGDANVASFGDLAGRTVYMTGKGTTPEYVMNYLLERAGLTGQVALEFKSEPTEVLSALLADPSAVGVLPEPFKTAAIAKSEGKLSAPVSLTDVWDELAGDTGSRLLTGVTVVRRAFAEEHPEAVAEFLRCHAASVKAVNAAPADWAQAVVDAGIVDNATIAEKAIPGCMLVCQTGKDMKAALGGYLQVLADADESAVGGKLPADDFYYME